MRLQIYVPKGQAHMWSPEPGFITWQEFLRRVSAIAGGVTVTSATGHWNGKGGLVQEPVYVVDALIQRPGEYTKSAFISIKETWSLFREYAAQLIANGEESVLIVRDNEPTLIRAPQ